jgi:hypothetical protein
MVGFNIFLKAALWIGQASTITTGIDKNIKSQLLIAAFG